MLTDNDIYTRYRKGLIQRHIAQNGRLLEGIWLIEDGGGTSTPEWQAICRSTEEKLQNGNLYTYNAYPLIIPDKFYDQPPQFYLAGGGDNPLLMGGLAMAVFAIETLLNVSPIHSLEQAWRLLKFTYSSQVPGNSGFFTRKRHFYRRSDQFSMDEISGMLIGLLFLMKAARIKGDDKLKEYVSHIAPQLGRFLKENEYIITAPNVPGRGDPREVRGQFAFVFQYPIGRALKDITGKAWQAGVTIPDGFDPTTESIADPLIDLVTLGCPIGDVVTFLNGLKLDFNYTPQDLFEDALGSLGGLYNIKQANLYNATMMVYCLLMIIESTATDKKTRKKIAQLGNNFIKAISYDQGPLDGAKKPFRHNCLFAVVAKRCAALCGDDDSGWNDALDNKIARLQNGDKTWFPNLPLGTPSDSATQRFCVTNDNGKFLWGGWYAWTIDGTHDVASFLNRPSWNLKRTINHISPFESSLDQKQVSGSKLGYPYSSVPRDKKDPSLGLRAESSGVDFLFARALASYYGYLPNPVLVDGDPEYASLPIDGALSDGFLCNALRGELHDLSVADPRCRLDKISEENERWYKTYWEASIVHHYNDCFKCLPGPRYRHARDDSNNRPYLGNKRSNEVHSKATATKRCHLDYMSEKNMLYYDTLDDAIQDGLDPCSRCIGASDH